MKNKALKRLIYGLPVLLASLPFFSSAKNLTPRRDTVTAAYKLKTVVIDAGHGTRPNGTHSGASGSYSQESNVTLAIALKLQKAIEKDIPDLNVVMTRKTEADVGLKARSEIANSSKGDLFISIHCNSLADRRVREVVGHKHGRAVYRTVSVPDRSGKGVLFLVYGFHRSEEEQEALRENLFEEKDNSDQQDILDNPAAVIAINAFKAKYRKQSIHFANMLNSEFTEGDGRRSDGVKEQGVLVLCHSAMPAVLIETGFINNREEEDYLNSEAGQNEIVASIVRALSSYKAELEQVSQ
ncbi:MAG: N-acetylmuramoyl-L-alanine amidase family protein [Mucilaginibacter sp.]|uniref:N-acetylmuramoyl-L-alanine amidase family protein n=1 Tax=Mucilaginibacter sp. L3T2-6 TaxID=3062491 RepID=UPI002676BB8F|nr:N-acetylmuramoyl-L-alanine amidase [Mucilaginibacter sp. L3T2-6]MDO3643112.1 N-acetylmuramoyl-L-alanine amidase [Mucilaginibacter sp. L3T2-6]MDV6215879.1 N-acetylmuramoyl-L-alanine amidase [Mucilaginibacter sp. L3T2-6]